MRNLWKMRLLVVVVVVLLPGAMLAPVWHNAGLGAGEDDILYYYPTRVLFHDLIRGGHWPWLNNWTGLTRPLMADPQTAIWYPATWLAAALHPLRAYPLTLWIHYSLALAGMYRLLRSLALDRRAALFGAVAFAFSGFLVAHRVHLTMQSSAAWTPWVFWGFHRYIAVPVSDDRQAVASGVRRLVTAAALLSLQCFAGQVQIVALTACGALVFVLAGRQQPTATAVPLPRPTLRVTRWLMVCVCAAGLFAVQWLPTATYVGLCTRGDRSYLDFVENSWNPASIIGWVLPMVYGQRTPNFFDQPYWGPSHQVEQFAYAGIAPLLLAALALRTAWRGDSRRRPWVVLALLSLLLALGLFGPVCPLLYWIPGSRLFRCPARALLLVNLSIAALAAITLHDLAAQPTAARARLRAALIEWTRRPLVCGALLVLVPLGLILLVAPLLGALGRAAALAAVRPWNPAVWVPLLAIVVTCSVLSLVARRWTASQLLWLPVVCTVLDLSIIGWTIDVPGTRTTPAELLEPPGATEWVQAVRESQQRLWVVAGRQNMVPGVYRNPLEKVSADTNILRGVVTLADYGPLQPRSVVDRFGFQPWGESWKAQALLTDTAWTRLYNVGWILLCDERMPQPANCERWTGPDTRWPLYRCDTTAGWAFIEPADYPGAARCVRQSPNAFTTYVDTWPGRRGRGGTASSDRQSWPRLVVSQLAMPGWTARVGEQPVKIETVDGTLMGVRVPPGEAVTITWSYTPPGLRFGAVVTLVSGIVLLAAVALFGRRNGRRAGGRGARAYEPTASS